MKTGTDATLKFKKLQRRLRLPRWQCVGLLETLWLTTYANAHLGDIGRLSDEDIAAALEWEGDAGELIEALCETRWLDRDSEFRLIVHDWSEHAAKYLKGAVERHGAVFADVAASSRANSNGANSSPARQGANSRGANECAQYNPRAQPNLTKPNLTSATNQTEPNLSGAGAGAMAAVADALKGFDWDGFEWRSIIADCNQFARLLRPESQNDRDEVLKIYALVVLGYIEREWVDHALSYKSGKRRKWAAFHKALAGRCEDHELNFNRLLKCVAIPDRVRFPRAAASDERPQMVTHAQ